MPSLITISSIQACLSDLSTTQQYPGLLCTYEGAFNRMQWNEPETFHILLASVSIAIWEPYDYGQIGRSAQACAVHLDLCLLDGILGFLLYLQFTSENSFRITDLSITCPRIKDNKYAQNERIYNCFPFLTCWNCFNLPTKWLNFGSYITIITLNIGTH